MELRELKKLKKLRTLHFSPDKLICQADKTIVFNSFNSLNFFNSPKILSHEL